MFNTDLYIVWKVRFSYGCFTLISSYAINGIKRDALRQAAVSGNSQSVNAKTEDTSKTEDNTTVKGNFPYKEGIYYGTAEGYNGEIEVAVVLQDKSINC